MFDKIKATRPIPDQNRKRDAFFSVCVVLLGLTLGYAAKAADSVSLLGDIGTDLGIWVFVAALICAFSRSPIGAAINAPLFFLSVLCAYYLYGQMVLGFFPKEYFLGWLVMSFLSPIGGLLAWFSRGKGWIANGCAALPAALLFAWGYPAFYTLQIPLTLDVLYGVVLLLILPKTWRERAVALGIACALAFVVVQASLLQYLPF